MVLFGEFFFIIFIVKNIIFLKFILWLVFVYIERVNYVLGCFVIRLILYMYFYLEMEGFYYFVVFKNVNEVLF